MNLKRNIIATVASCALIFSGSPVAYADASADNTSYSVRLQQDVSESFAENGHTYTVEYDASERTFASYLDGELVRKVSYEYLESEIEKVQQSALENRAASKCSVGMATVSVINTVLWTAAGIATGGVAVPVAGVVTGLIPTVAGVFC